MSAVYLPTKADMKFIRRVLAERQRMEDIVNPPVTPPITPPIIPAPSSTIHTDVQKHTLPTHPLYTAHHAEFDPTHNPTTLPPQKYLNTPIPSRINGDPPTFEEVIAYFVSANYTPTKIDRTFIALVLAERRQMEDLLSRPPQVDLLPRPMPTRIEPPAGSPKNNKNTRHPNNTLPDHPIPNSNFVSYTPVIHPKYLPIQKYLYTKIPTTINGPPPTVQMVIDHFTTGNHPPTPVEIEFIKSVVDEREKMARLHR